MPIPRAQHRLLLAAGLGVVAAWVCAGFCADWERELHAGYARALAEPSRTQAALLVAIDEAGLREADLRARLEPVIAAGSPRLVVWPAHSLAQAATWPEGQVGDPGYSLAGAEGLGVDPLLGAPVRRVGDPEFPAAVLTALGLPARTEPLPTRYVSQLPRVSALRVAAGEIPASTFRDRVVIVGRTDAAATTVATPLGPMSPAQVEAHAILGALDGALWRPTPAWWARLVGLTVWALGLALALRRRGLWAVLLSSGLALAIAAMVDAVLFATGVMRLGVGAAAVVVVVVAGARLLGLAEGALRADLLERSGAHGGASGLHKVSDA